MHERAARDADRYLEQYVEAAQMGVVDRAHRLELGAWGQVGVELRHLAIEADDEVAGLAKPVGAGEQARDARLDVRLW